MKIFLQNFQSSFWRVLLPACLFKPLSTEKEELMVNLSTLNDTISEKDQAIASLQAKATLIMKPNKQMIAAVTGLEANKKTSTSCTLGLRHCAVHLSRTYHSPGSMRLSMQ
jgi:hypothetical protein